MQYPLPEQIGEPDLLVGREKEFAEYGKWIRFIPRRLSKSRVILARRKSGKTAFVQRIFNQLWTENGAVIPCYINISERRIWFPYFAITYYTTFASQYISFLERDPNIVRNPFSLEEIRQYGLSKYIKPLIDDVDAISRSIKEGGYDLAWHTAATAPHRMAALYDIRFLVMIDEFQNTGEYIYRDQECHTSKDPTIPGTWHDLSESKLAPMLVTGSYVGWLINIIDTYLEAGRLKRFVLNPYLIPEEGLQAVYQYSRLYEEPITNETALQINRLCMSDPFFISCVIQSKLDGKDLTTESGVVNTVHYEITDRLSEMSMTWGEYIELSLKRINTIHSKHIMLHLSKYPDRDWTPRELKAELHLPIEEKQILELLRNMYHADLIREGTSDIDFRGLTDGTLGLILRTRFQKEIETHQPPADFRKDFQEDLRKLKQEKRSLQGMVNQLSGKMAEYQLFTEFRSARRFSLSRYFENVGDDTLLNIAMVKMRKTFQRPDGKDMEMDVVAESDCGRIILVEVKKTREPVGVSVITDFLEKVTVYAGMHPENRMLPAVFSTGGFTQEARQYCEDHGIAMAQSINLKIYGYSDGESLS
ncbi:MAG: restriction endonuclease [Desulfatirhabdiaceae bacterium]